MNASRTAAAVLLAATVLLAPAVAQADPWVDASTDGAPITDVSTGTIGQPMLIQGNGCDNSTGTAVMGEFTANVGDPALLDAQQQRDAVAAGQLFQIEMPVTQQGTFTWNFSIPLDNATGTFSARWYCATAPVTSLYDPAITWVSPTATMTIEAPPVAARSAKSSTTAVRTGQRVAFSTTAASAPAPTVSFDFDPDALPLIDRVAIPGPKAAALKARVDASVAKATALRARLARLVQRFDPKAAAALRKPVTNAEYVTAAHLELTHRLPSSKALKASTARLDGEQLRVQVVEDIALTAHPVSWWNAQR